MLDRERCVLCYRCVRFHEEIPGDRALAVLDRGGGSASKPGLYLQYQRRVPNNWSRPHYHPIDRVVMVLGGTMLIGADASGDKTRTVGVPKGGFIRDIAKGVHYDGSGDDPMWIQIAGVGPSATINVDPPK